MQKAVDEGIPVIGYDRLIENPNAFYITFDNKEVGRMQARGCSRSSREGNYAFIKGSSADPNAYFLFAGQMEVLNDAIDAGKIKNVGEAFTDGWLPANAQKNMEQMLTKNNNKVDAVVAANDGTAGGAIAALAAQGMAGAVPVSGQDGDHAALNRIALGTQTVSVWKDARALGKKAAEIAAQLADGKKMTDISGVVKFAGGPKKVEMNALFLTPVPITKDNLNVVIDAGWIRRDELCQGINPARSKFATDRVREGRKRRGLTITATRHLFVPSGGGIDASGGRTRNDRSAGSGSATCPAKRPAFTRRPS